MKTFFKFPKLVIGHYSRHSKKKDGAVNDRKAIYKSQNRKLVMRQ